MSDDISLDVGYLLDQLNEVKRGEQQHTCKLQITYGTETIDGHNRLTKEQTQEQPTIGVTNGSGDNTYRTLVMIDPDAPNRDQPITGPFVHWVLANFQEKDGKDGKAFCPYMGPGPRPGTGTHRYIFLLYQSVDAIEVEEKTYDIPQRRKYPLSKLVTDNGLELLDVTLFTVDA